MQFELKGHFPQLAGVYVCADNWSVIYVGRTKNLRQRFYQHHKIADMVELGITKVHFRFVLDNDVRELSRLEKLFIDAFEPPLNRIARSKRRKW
ncbi:GIY-YIG nuclease family protein [Kovacikia minuta CCNUW1]|uniref:GIY-YIG nuclease family protein n=1 Tax=Kovacikia minuta TaxID=2931930 RepID=UPI001CCEFEC4|nr:GIY-YIG nuclease family protein [Kovacikia minuta CCNUW1]